MPMRVVIAVCLASSVLAAQGQIPAPPPLTFAFEVRATVAAPTEVGQVPHGRRRIVAITGGTFEGPGIRGRVVPGGADWQIVRPDGSSVADIRYTLETDRGALLYVQSHGVRHGKPEVLARLAAGEDVDPSEYTFRTAVSIETSGPRVGVAQRRRLHRRRRTPARRRLIRRLPRRVATVPDRRRA